VKPAPNERVVFQYRWLFVSLVTAISTTLAADKLSEKLEKRLNSTNLNYQAAAVKADNAKFFAVQNGNCERLKVLKSDLMDASKMGDFGASTANSERLATAESAGTVGPKPKNLVRFWKGSYALFENFVTWHVAKRIWEEMVQDNEEACCR
jgi:hypothetical protein